MSESKPSTYMSHIVANQSHIQLSGLPCIHVQEIEWKSGVRSWIMAGLATNLVQELNVGTVYKTYKLLTPDTAYRMFWLCQRNKGYRVLLKLFIVNFWISISFVHFHLKKWLLNLNNFSSINWINLPLSRPFYFIFGIWWSLVNNCGCLKSVAMIFQFFNPYILNPAERVLRWWSVYSESKPFNMACPDGCVV